MPSYKRGNIPVTMDLQTRELMLSREKFLQNISPRRQLTSPENSQGSGVGKPLPTKGMPPSDSVQLTLADKLVDDLVIGPAGTRLNLRFTGSPVVQSGARLQINGTFTPTDQNDVLSLLSDGEQWWEVGRSQHAINEILSDLALTGDLTITGGLTVSGAISLGCPVVINEVGSALCDPLLRIERGSDENFVYVGQTPFIGFGFQAGATPAGFQIGTAVAGTPTELRVPDNTSLAFLLTMGASGVRALSWDTSLARLIVGATSGTPLKLSLDAGTGSATSRIEGHLEPHSNNTYDVGSIGQLWRDGNFAGTVTQEIAKVQSDGTGIVDVKNAAGDDRFTVDSTNGVVAINRTLVAADGTLQVEGNINARPTGFLKRDVSASGLFTGETHTLLDLDLDYDYDGVVTNDKPILLNGRCDVTNTAGTSLLTPQLCNLILTGDAGSAIGSGATGAWYAEITTARALNGPSDGYFYFIANNTGSPAGTQRALRSKMVMNGSGQGIGYQGLASSSAGHTGSLIGVEGLVTDVSGIDYVVGLQGNCVLASNVVADKRVSLRGNVGHGVISQGSMWVASTSRLYPNAITPTHLATTDDGQLWCEDAAEVEGHFYADGGQTVARAAKTAGYTATTADHIIGCDSSGGAFTITLMAAATAGAGFLLEIADETMSAGTNAVTIDGDGTETIDGNLTVTISGAGDCLSLYCTGTGWKIY